MKQNVILCILLCLCICFLPCTVCAASTADAVEPIRTAQACSLTVNYTHGKTVFADIPVQLYCIAEVSSDFQYTLTDAFRSTHQTVNGIQSANEWNTVRTTLESVTLSKKLVPDRTAVTDSRGSAAFSGLVPGLYFIMPVQISGDGVNYYFDSALVAVPNLNDKGTWDYDVTVAPKPGMDKPTGKEVQYKVVKLWQDNAHTELRPPSIVADIYCNGRIVESVTLSADNHWSYSWTATDNGDIWQVAEQTVPDGYVMFVEKHAAAFSIINAIPGVHEPPQTGDSANIGLYILLLCLSGILLVILGAAAKRNAAQ